MKVYTIKTLDDGRVVNSYNLSTPIITPKQAIDNQNNDYDEAVITSNFGIGESVVGGIVTPDEYIVNKATRNEYDFIFVAVSSGKISGVIDELKNENIKVRG